jgi:type II secretory pathway pseudopilin PulG
VAIIAILAGIAMFNYFNGIQRARQKKTMADIRGIAMAWEARESDMRGYNAAGFTVPAAEVSASEIDTLLIPTYTKSFPHVDGWSHPMRFEMVQPVGGPPAATYAVRSAGADGVFQASYVQGPTSSFDCDIVYANGAFICYPNQ